MPEAIRLVGPTMKYHPSPAAVTSCASNRATRSSASIAEFARRRKVPGGWFTGLGSLDRAVLGFLDPKEKVYLKRTFDERMEIGSLSGNIAWNDDEPVVHVHAVLSPRELLAYTGHLHEGEVGVVVEILVTALEGGLRRVVDPVTGFGRIVLPGEAATPSDAVR